MSQIIQHFKIISDITHGMQKQFWEWKYNNAKVVKLTPLEEVFKLYPHLVKHIKRVKAKPRECYANSGKLLMSYFDSNLKYIEGEVSYKGIPISHAWNKIDDIYFDLTLNEKDLLEYVEIIELDNSDYMYMIDKYGHYGGFVSEYFIKNVLNESHLNESPDRIHYNGKYIHYQDKNEKPIPFFVILELDKNVNIKQHKVLDVALANPINYAQDHFTADNDFLNQMAKYENCHRNFPGRVYPKQKVITFWSYPSDSQIVEVFNIIVKKLDSIANKHEWKIEYSPDELGFNDLGDGEFLSIDEFVKLEDVKDNESGYEEHLKSPLLKKSKEVKGFGANHPKYQEKRFWERNKPFENKIENFYPRLFESPDRAWSETDENGDYEMIARWDDSDARAFGYHSSGVFVCAKNSFEYHRHLDEDRYSMEFPGRLWLNRKIISFWRYPDSEKFKEIKNRLESFYKINIDDTWKIETYYYDDDENMYIKHVTPSEYIKNYKYYVSHNPPPAEFNKDHELSPLLKKSKEVKGFGANHPKYQEKRFWERNKPFENKTENFYPRLFENPDGIHMNNVVVHYSNDDAYPFAVAFDSETEDNFQVLIGENGMSHGQANLGKLDAKFWNLTNMTSPIMIWPGRLWKVSKVISFWVMPKKKYLVDICKQLSVIIGDNVFDYLIETHLNQNQGFEYFAINGNYSKLVKVSEYLKSELESLNPSQEEYEEHLKSPLLKKSKENKGFGSEHPKYQQKRFWERSSPFEGLKSKGLKEGLLSAYYEKRFGIPSSDAEGKKDYSIYDIVSYVGRLRTPIVKNPKTLKYIEKNVKAIADLEGNLYVMVNNTDSNHGEIGNSLIRSNNIISTIYGKSSKYNTDKKRLSDMNLGIYEDENFVLLDRLNNSLVFVGSDMQIAHKNTDIILKRLNNKFPLFKFKIKTIEDDIE